MQYGFDKIDTTYVKIGEDYYGISTKDSIKEKNTANPNEKHYRYFRHQVEEPRHVYETLKIYYNTANELFDNMKTEMKFAAVTTEKWREESKKHELAKRVAPFVDGLENINLAIQEEAKRQLAHVDEIERLAALPVKPATDHEQLLQRMELASIRQEIAGMDKDQLAKVLDRIGADRERDQLLIAALETSFAAPVERPALDLARKKIAKAHFPWLETMREEKRDLVKWAGARAQLDSIATIRGLMPDGITLDNYKGILARGDN